MAHVRLLGGAVKILRALATGENLAALLLAGLACLLAVATADTAPIWIYQSF